MQQFIEKYREQIQGVVSGFDRLVFRGSLRRLNYVKWNSDLQALQAKGMEEYLWQNKILFKDYQDHVKKVSEQLKEHNLKPFREQGLKPSGTKRHEISLRRANKRRFSSTGIRACVSYGDAPSKNAVLLHT